MSRKVLIAVAWPYANGSLHLGHVAALLPADVLARYHRLKGDDVLCVSGSDCHGTPILVTAERLKEPPRTVAERFHNEFVATMAQGLGISYTLYSATMGEFHRRVAQQVFRAVYDAGMMVERTEPQPYCEHCRRFLPDRYVEGTCPHCQHEGARGDQCDHCGQVLDASELINPHCRTCNSVPIIRMSKHLYLDLPSYQQALTEWFGGAHGSWRPNAVGMTESWLTKGLKQRPVTRDTDWGIPVPVPGYEGKCIYVWFEAVTGYLSCSQEWAAGTDQPEQWRAWWENSDAWHYYVHGKDNIPFHTLIWPAILKSIGLHLPNQVVSSEYLQLEGLQFSKSRNWAIYLPQALATFDADAIRFYIMQNNPENKDTSFSWTDFGHRVNGDLIGNMGNFWHRTFSLVNRYYGEIPRSGVCLSEVPLIRHLEQAFARVGAAIERASFREAVSTVLEASSMANRYIHEREPWKRHQAGDGPHVAETLEVCANVANALRVLSYPFVPFGSGAFCSFLGLAGPDAWEFRPLPAGLIVGKPDPFFKKIDDSIVAEELRKLQEVQK